MKVAAYVRVSTETQTTDNQLPALESYCQFRDWEIVAVYSESESAWKAGHQKALAQLLDDVRLGRRKYDVLLCWALDRLSRQGAASILNLVNTFKVYDVRVISLQESWTELPGELGEVLFAIAGWVARMESQRRSERTKAGLARAIREGKKLGRPKGSQDKSKRNNGGYLLRYHKGAGLNKGAVNDKAKSPV
jgi:DNA invertase Pin-like site-specific DNA recombinase